MKKFERINKALSKRALQGFRKAIEIMPELIEASVGVCEGMIRDEIKEIVEEIRKQKSLKVAMRAYDRLNKLESKIREEFSSEDDKLSEKFMDVIDAAAVYVNASTRFTDGFVFGLGAEIGISTQKMHARGPMGLEALTSTKYVIYGNGQIRK